MATYTDIFNLRNSGELNAKIQVACVSAAVSILWEAVTASNHANRVIWADKAFANAQNVANKMFWSIAMDSTVQTAGESISDDALQTVVNSYIDLYAKDSVSAW